MKHLKITHGNRGKRGFALVATISVMVLLVMVALAMLSLSTIETRQSRQSSADAEAQANARLALMLAIGKLQVHAGPDQRVTAPADLANGNQHPHWVGIWKTTASSGMEPVIRWNDDQSSLVDERVSGGNYDKTLAHLAWLVSGDGPSPDSAISGASVNLVQGGSASHIDDYVEVPLETVTANGQPRGALAYWVSDESTKARLDLHDRYKNEQPLAADHGSPGYKRLLSPENYGVSSLTGLQGHTDITGEDMAKMLDVSQAALGGLPKAALKENFHGLTTSSLGLFTDTLRSGLRGDLSTFIEEGDLPQISGVAGSAIDENTPLIASSRRDNSGPKFGVLRSWANLANDVGSGGQLSPRGMDSAAYTAAGKYGKYPNFSKQTSQAVHPVIVEASLTTRICYVKGFVTVHLFPRIVLWNPYNVELDAKQYVIDFNLAVQDSFRIEKRVSGVTTAVKNSAYDTRNPNLASRRMALTTDSTAFKPGEALVFSPVPTSGALAGKSSRLNLRTNSIQNRISAEVDPHSLTNFYVALTDVSSNGIAKTDLPIYANHNGGSYYWIDMMDWWWGNNDNGLKVGLHMLEGSANNYNALVSSQKLLQIIDTDNWKRGYQGRFNNGRWKVGGVEAIYDYETTSSFQPWARTHYGIRFKWVRETNPYNLSGGGAGAFWHTSPISTHNLRAAISHRSPYDSVCDNGEAHHWYTWGPYAVERQQAQSHNHADYAGHPGPNGYRANVFFNGGNTNPNHVYPLFDVPGKNYRVHSMGAFRHAQLSQQIWHPSYAIGNSRVPVNLFERERTAADASAIATQWGSDMPYLPNWLRLHHNSSLGTADDAVMYDLAYEANHALWDSYFVSTATNTEKELFADDPGGNPLPNTRIVPISSLDVDKLKDGRKAASQLGIRGPFNVNSTNKSAWVALLSSFKGVKTPQGVGVGDESLHPFPRFLNPARSAYSTGDAYALETWTGYRALTDGQIDQLAEQIVEEVKLRGPFVSISDFVNRRLIPESATDQETGLMGTIDAAIANTDLNSNLDAGEAVMPQNYAGVDESYSVASRGNPEHFPGSKVEGSPGWLMQGDILQQVGSVLTARGDTFVIRAYGESRDAAGKTKARAWCEATVQRLPEYLKNTDGAEIPASLSDGSENLGLSEVNRKFGRRFIITGFRWLNPTEI